MVGFDLVRKCFEDSQMKRETHRGAMVANTRLLANRRQLYKHLPSAHLCPPSLRPPFPVTTAKYPRAFIGNSLPSKMESI